ncbi:MAG: hypothetical protein DRN20_03050 [Thermoplasmata archaeon]|nr:MAG: hypothetical protein DRN20_03050 [Thermoplasmata archaeon]
MKDRLSSADVYVLVKELQCLLQSYLDKVHTIDNQFVFSFRKRGKKFHLVLLPKGWAYLAEGFQVPETPSKRAMHLRRLLENSRVIEVKQHGFERIICMYMHRFGKKLGIMIELFGDGNVVVINDENIILWALRSRKWRHREIKQGLKYQFPPERANPWEISFKDFCMLLRSGRGDVVKNLATNLNLGGQLAEEVCRRAGIEKSTDVRNLDDNMLGALFVAMASAFEDLKNAKGAYICVDDESELWPIPPTVCEKFTEYSEISKAIEFYLSTTRKDEEKSDEEMQKLMRVLERQKIALEDAKQDAMKFAAIGDAIYENYGMIDRILRDVIPKLMHGDKDAEKIAKKYGAFVSDGRVYAELETAVGRVMVPIDGDKSVQEIAAEYYERAKAMKKKAERIEKAIEGMKEKIKRRTEEREEKRARKVRKTFWFEKYKWFISSEGNLVICGRDAKTNERIVKRHMGEDDIYMHADIHGAPSVVIRGKCSEKTLKEAAIFAAAHSKAWSAGFGSADVFWVRAEQVSKKPPSGEYLPRGSFMIYGKKNYIRKVPLLLAIGVVEYDGVHLAMCAPESAVSHRTNKYVVICPGKADKNTVAKRIAEFLGVDTGEIVRILPPNGIEIKEIKGEH